MRAEQEHKNTVLCKRRREASDGTLNLDFRPPKLGKETFLLFKSPSLRHLLWQLEKTHELCFRMVCPGRDSGKNLSTSSHFLLVNGLFHEV